MRKTNKMMRSGTAIMVLAGLGLSSSIVATAASEPVEQAVKTVIKTVELQPEPQAPETLKPEIQKLADAAEGAPTPKPPVKSAATVKAEKPLSTTTVLATLSLRPATMDPAIEAEMNRRRFAVADGTLPVTAISEWPGMRSGHIEVDVTPQGAGQATVRDIEGIAIEGVDKTEILASLNPLLNLCSTHSKISITSDYYRMAAGIPEIEYQATCKPKPKTNQPSNLTVDEEIAILLADNDIPMSTRKARARGMKAGSMFRKYKAETPNPTRQQDYDFCIYSFRVLNEGFRYENMPKQTDAEIEANCEEIVTRDFGPRPE